MPRSTPLDEPAAPQTVEEKMDVIIAHLERLDARDRLRMWGSVLHSLIAVIPMLLFLWSIWYFYAHGAELMELMMRVSAQSAAQSTSQGYQDVLDQLKEYFGG